MGPHWACEAVRIPAGEEADEITLLARGEFPMRLAVPLNEE